jgi:hypothetical protein
MRFSAARASLMFFFHLVDLKTRWRTGVAIKFEARFVKRNFPIENLRGILKLIIVLKRFWKFSSNGVIDSTQASKAVVRDKLIGLSRKVFLYLDFRMKYCREFPGFR